MSPNNRFLLRLVGYCLVGGIAGATGSWGLIFLSVLACWIITYAGNPNEYPVASFTIGDKE